jgi:aminoglycoside phosphotransferase (APT) family kinase protein
VIPGVPDEARWIRSQPRRALDAPILERLVRTAFPRCHVVGVQPLTDGFRNTNLKVKLNTRTQWIVVRIYEHDASLCQKEIDLLQLVGGSVPVPDVIHAEPAGLDDLHAEPAGLDDLPPFALSRYVEGINFRELNRCGDNVAIAQAPYSAGETLAAIGRARFPRSGWLAPGPSVTAPLLEGAAPTPRFVDLCLASASLKLCMPAELRDRTQALVWARASQLVELECQAQLVHGDFGKRNLLIRRNGERWEVAAVLDWEFAVSGSPLADLGHFLRYECTTRPSVEPHFSGGYLRGGGTLPHEWRSLARLIDLAALLREPNTRATPRRGYCRAGRIGSGDCRESRPTTGWEIASHQVPIRCHGDVRQGCKARVQEVCLLRRASGSLRPHEP